MRTGRRLRSYGYDPPVSGLKQSDFSARWWHHEPVFAGGLLEGPPSNRLLQLYLFPVVHPIDFVFPHIPTRLPR